MIRKLVGTFVALGIAATGLVVATSAEAATPAVTAKFCASQPSQHFYTQSKGSRTCMVIEGVQSTTGIISNSISREEPGGLTETWTAYYQRLETYRRTTTYTQSTKTGLVTVKYSYEFVSMDGFVNQSCALTAVDSGGSETFSEPVENCALFGLYV